VTLFGSVAWNLYSSVATIKVPTLVDLDILHKLIMSDKAHFHLSGYENRVSGIGVMDE
jgi:hypothetical protein